MEVPRGALCLLLLYCCSILSFANPTCKRNCRGAGGPFLPGQVYKYHLKGSTVTQLPGSPDDVTSLGISATAEVFAESKCQHVLKLSDVEVKGPDGKLYNGLSADCAKPVRFSYSDGKLDEVCGQADDEGASLNIKRAVISLLSSVKNQDGDSGSASENDIFGICPTEFSISHEGSKVKIHKTKDLNRCALRENFNFPFPTTTYQAVQSSFGKFESTPLLGSQLSVTQEIENGVLQKAEGSETYNYRPLMNPEAGALVKVLYTLILQSSGPGAIPANVNSPKRIFYEAAHDSDGIKNQRSIAAALQKAVDAIDPVATPEAAKEFANLVHVIEEGNKADILAAYSAAQGKTAKNLFLDGLLYAGSAESVEAAAELLSTKRIPEDSALLWYLDLNFVKHVSRGSLTSLLPLLSGDNVPYQAYLGIGSVAGKFCLQHPQLCETSQEYKQLLARLAAPLAGGCKVDSHDKENNIIASLKGLRNTRHLTAEIVEQISQCAADSSARSRVRVAALEAFHADASKPVLIQTAITILHNVEEDSELRIQAYLALVANPTPKVADIVKELIDKEPVNQVGSFIVSHLRNIRASTNPEKQAAKIFLGNIISKKKFPFDQRKFSRNLELSYSLDALNVGVAGELNRIFSQKSFIYRSVSLNLTTQLFGHSVNLAEVGLRLENLEWYFEKYFGPRGILKSKGSELVDEYADEAEKVMNENVERNKRSINKQQTLAAIDKIKLGPDYEDRHTNIDLSLKLFGSDIAWMNYHHDKFDFEGMKKKLYGKKDEFLDDSKNMDIDYKKARTFLDAGLTYPTGLGLGLKIKVNGNYAVNLKFNGKADLKAIMNNPRNTHFAFQIVPSGSLELASTLAVDADVVESGVKVSANVHSSTGTDLTVKVLDGYGVDVKLGLPVKKQEILNFHSDVFSVVREKTGSEVETPVTFNVKREDLGGCFDQLNTLIGLTVCGEVSMPLDGFKVLSPAYGPSKASLRIEKEDESLTAYHFRTFYDNKQPDKVSLEVLLDTPNSKTDRKVLLSVKGSMKPQKQLLIAMESPLTVPTTFEALVIDTELEQAISAKLTSGTAEHFFKIGAHISGDINRRKYEPILEYKFPEASKSDKEWIGRKGVKGGRQQQSALGISGAVYVEKNPGTPYRKYELKSVTVTTSNKKLTLDGTITIDANLVATDLKASYDKDTVTLNSEIQKLGERKYIAKVDIVPSQYPDLGGSVKWEYERTPHKIEHNLVIVHGPDLKSEVSRISITQLFVFKHESAQDFDFHTVNTVSYPLLAFTGSLKGGVAPKSVMYDVDVTYDNHQIKSKLDAKRGMKEPTDYSVDFEAKALENSVDLTLKHERVSATKSKFTNSLEMKPGGKYQLNALVENNVKTGDVHQSFEVEIKMPQDPKTVKVKAERTHNSKEFELEFELTAGNKHVVDFEVECHKAADPSGKFKLSLPRYIDSHGVYDTKAGKATGSFYINVLKTGRKIEGKGELTRTSSHVVGFGELLWDANKDPSKKVYVKTDTSFSGQSIDTKNILQAFDHKTEVNLKGTMEGPWLDGTLEGEAEIVLPSGRIVAAKVNRVFHLVSEDNKIEGTWELADYASRNAQPRKLTLKLAGKNINPSKAQFDGQVDLTYTTPNRENLILHFVGKKVPQGEKWTIAGQGSVTGTMVKHPIHTKLNAEVTEQLLKGRMTDDGQFPAAHYDFELKAGNEIEVASNGKINQDQLNNDIEIKLPSDLAIKSVKWNMLHVSAKESTGKKIVNSNAIQWNGDKFVKYNTESYEKPGNHHGKITWESHEQSPHTLTYKVDDSENKVDLDLALEWEGKKADFSLKADAASEPVYLKISSNVPDHGNFEIDISGKNNMESAESLITIVANDKKMVFHARHSKSRTNPSLDIGLELPQGKSRFFGKLETKGEAHYLVESQIEWITNGGGTFDVNGEVNVRSFDDLFVKLFIDSPALNMNKVEFEAGRQLTKSSAKTIYFRGKANEKEISGSFTLVPKEDNLYEGSGVLKVGDESYPLQFKLKFNIQDKDEKDLLLDMKAGRYSYYAHTTALTDEASGLYKVETINKYCKGEKCHTEELKFSKHRTGPMEYETKFELQLSMSLFFLLEHPLKLKGHEKRQGLEFDRNMEVEYGPDKVQFHEYVKTDRAGAELILPKRTIAVEAIFDFDERSDNPKFKFEGNFWLDKKNAAADKTSVLLASDTNKHADAMVLSSEAHFSTPGMKELSLKNDLTINVKDHTIHAKFEADVFSKKNQKFVIEYKMASNKNEGTYSGNDHLHIHSKGLNIDAQLQRKATFSKNGFSYIITGSYIDSKQNKREGVAQVTFEPKHTEVVLKLPEGTVYAEESVLQGNTDSLNYHLTGETFMLGYKFEEQLDVKKEGPHFKYILSIIQKAENNPQLILDIGVDLEQLAEINLKYNRKILLGLEVALDESHFLKSKYQYNTDVAKEYFTQEKKNIVGMLKEASRIAKNTGAKVAEEVTDRVEDCRKALPNFKSAAQHYQKELQQFKNEITNNENVKGIVGFLRNTFGTVFGQIGAILHEIYNIVDKLISVLNDALKKITESFKATIPKLKEAYEKTSDIVVQMVDDILEYAKTVVDSVLDSIKQFEKEVEEVVGVVSDFFHEIGQLIAKALNGLRKEIKDFVQVLLEQIKTLPIYSMITEKLQELKNYQIPEQYWSTFQGLVKSVVDVSPTPELQKFIKSAAEYLEKFLKHQQFDKAEALKQLSREFADALDSLILILNQAAEEADSKAGPGSPPRLLLPAPSVGSFVAPPGTVRFSLLNWIKSPDLPSPSEFFHTYRPKNKPTDFLPPFDASALIIGGTEFFTFDGKHYSFKGSCSYILSTDVIDGNFTLVANMEAGKLKSLGIIVPDNSVELLNDGKVLFNGKPAEIPLKVGDLDIWKNYAGGTGAYTAWSGLIIYCTSQLQSCGFYIDGFYFGKTRGLLGTYNNEPYDDAMIPEGHVAPLTAAFANSWKVNPQCADGVHEQPAPAAPQCTKLFSGDSSLRSCFSFANPESFREACNKQVAEASGDAKEEAACNVAYSYVGHCYYVHFIKTRLPDHCGKCQVGSETLHVGESAPVKIPQSAADVVIVVEQLEDNEEIFNHLISPLVSTLRNDFKEKGIVDVNFALLGYGAHEQYWPSVYTFNGEINSFSGSAKNMYFDKEHNITEPKLSDKLQEIKKKLLNEIGLSKTAQAFQMALNYRFRPEALKTIVGVMASGCDRAVLPFQALRVFGHQLNLLNSGIVVNLVTPLRDLSLDGKDEKAAGNVVGFDSSAVYNQGEAKRKVLRGDEEALHTLKYTSDQCIDLTLGTNGAVFSSSNFIKGKPNLRKNFLQVLSNKITDSLTREEQVADCRCDVERGMNVITRCKITARREKEPLARNVKGVKG